MNSALDTHSIKGNFFIKSIIFLFSYHISHFMVEIEREMREERRSGSKPYSTCKFKDVGAFVHLMSDK